jgi:hypothetical protein
MPRATRVRFAAEFSQLRKQAGRLLAKVRSEIRSVETELARLRGSIPSLSTLAGLRQRRSERKAGRGVGGPSRVNWTKVLEQMPERFKAGNVRKVRAVQNKRPSEIFAAITRWIEAGTVKHNERGLYQKVQARKVSKAKPA